MNKNEYLKKRKMIFDETTFQILYLRYKIFIVPISIILVSISLIIVVLIPQLQELLALRAQTKEIPQKVQVLSNNVRFLSNLNQEALQNEISIVNLALPPRREYASVINAISQTSRVSGVSIGDYSFVVGEISTNSAQVAATVVVELTLNADLRATSRFIQELYKQLPITAVKKVDINGSSSQVKAEFFFRPIPQLQFDNREAIIPLTAQENTVLQTITQWAQQQSVVSTPQIIPSSSSAILDQGESQNP